jgi:transcriptional regulator GlxA family with amidase domain
VVDDGTLVTAGGITSGIDLALRIVDREVDPGLADRIAAAMEYRRDRDLYLS